MLLFWPTVLHRIDKCHHCWNYIFIGAWKVKIKASKKPSMQWSHSLHWAVTESLVKLVLCIILKLTSFKLLAIAFKTPTVALLDHSNLCENLLVFWPTVLHRIGNCNAVAIILEVFIGEWKVKIKASKKPSMQWSHSLHWADISVSFV